MPVGFDDAVANAMLDAFCNHTSYAGNAAVYVQLHTGGAGPSGTSNVATENTRKQVTFGTPAGGVCANSNTPTWAGVAATETITFISLWSASTAGTFLASGQLATPLALTAGQPLTINPGDLTVTLNDAG